MILINKHLKLSFHMALMPIDDRRHIKTFVLIIFSSAKFLVKGVNVVPFSNSHNIVSSLSADAKTNHQWISFFRFLKLNLGLNYTCPQAANHCALFRVWE